MGKGKTKTNPRSVKAARKFLKLPVAEETPVIVAGLQYAALIAEWEETPAESEREQEIKGRMEELIRDCSNPEELIGYWDITKSHSLKQLIQESIEKLFAAVCPRKKVPEWAISMLHEGAKEERHAFLRLQLKALAERILIVVAEKV